MRLGREENSSFLVFGNNRIELCYWYSAFVSVVILSKMWATHAHSLPFTWRIE